MTNTTTNEAKYANLIGYTDVRAHEVVRVISENCIEIRRMKAEHDNWKPEIVPGGFSGHCANQCDQTWRFESDDSETVFRIRKSRARRTAGQWFDVLGRRFSLESQPREFFDYNF